MPLPDGPVPLALGERKEPVSLLVRFPEDTWSKLIAAADGGGLSLTVDEGVTLNFPDQDPIPLDTHSTGQPSEIFSYDGGQLAPIGSASVRLSVPFTIGATSRAAEKVRQQSEALDRERQERAGRVTGKPVAATTTHSRPVEPSNFRPSSLPARSLAMARTQSGPPATNWTVDRVPLKTLVIQLLALGPATLDEIVEGTEGGIDDVSRAVNVIALKPTDSSGKYTLVPKQYAKIKIGGWDRYSYDDKLKVVAMARKAFDELGLPADSEERQELAKKEAEVLAAGPPEPEAGPSRKPSPPQRKSISPVKRSELAQESSRAASPSSAPPKKDQKERTKVGKQIAKMRNDHMKRTASLPPPNVKGSSQTSEQVEATSVSPPTEPVKPPKAKPKPKAESAKSAKPAEKKASPPGAAKRKQSAERRESSARDYTSSDDSSGEDRGRRRAPKSTNATANGNGKAAAAAANAVPSKRHKSPVYTSSDDDTLQSKAKRKRDENDTPTRLLPSFKRRTSDEPIKSKDAKTNGHREGTPRTPSNPDIKELRKRYEELYPKYEKLASSLATLYQTAERVRDGAGSPGPLPNEPDLANKVKQWEEWHRELESIRSWFSA